jgi:hypothetical protein
MGGAGMLSASYRVPVIGKSYDAGIATRIPQGMEQTALKAAAIRWERLRYCLPLYWGCASGFCCSTSAAAICTRIPSSD